MPEKVPQGDYPLIDIDPHIKRVVAYFRPSDYAAWATVTAAFPALYAWLYYGNPETMVVHDNGKKIVHPFPNPHAPRQFKNALVFAAGIGFMGGFLLATQNSTLRFYGWKENKREYDRDLKELSALAKAGKPLYGVSTLSPYVQGVAHRNSMWNPLFITIFPSFNFVNHPYHGVDTTRYYEAAGVPPPKKK